MGVMSLQSVASMKSRRCCRAAIHVSQNMFNGDVTVVFLVDWRSQVEDAAGGIPSDHPAACPVIFAAAINLSFLPSFQALSSASSFPPAT